MPTTVQYFVQNGASKHSIISLEDDVVLGLLPCSGKLGLMGKVLTFVHEHKIQVPLQMLPFEAKLAEVEAAPTPRQEAHSTLAGLLDGTATADGDMAINAQSIPPHQRQRQRQTGSTDLVQTHHKSIHIFFFILSKYMS